MFCIPHFIRTLLQQQLNVNRNAEREAKNSPDFAVVITFSYRVQSIKVKVIHNRIHNVKNTTAQRISSLKQI